MPEVSILGRPRPLHARAYSVSEEPDNNALHLTGADGKLDDARR
jgi:hypothetical protein